MYGLSLWECRACWVFREGLDGYSVGLEHARELQQPVGFHDGTGKCAHDLMEENLGGKIWACFLYFDSLDCHLSCHEFFPLLCIGQRRLKDSGCHRSCLEAWQWEHYRIGSGVALENTELQEMVLLLLVDSALSLFVFLVFHV
jgi:hypothetical protein